ncbi:hypothetical protein ASD24_27385 [Paenibacillus sp. Root52]|uniref:non-ribosomal peptide synthetase n=1 Tax=Paenibacillus sp. Root52 TaxID=1736552 RepID=UPI0006F69910|nr:non-ribosomal peptide synthetase [Paenibacillus sp. Root52]KQY86557.1 hypothetical protein ASD24_27385 [Paenibacillus sp. Root52]
MIYSERSISFLDVDHSLIQELRGICRAQDTSMSMMILAAVQVLLHRYSGKDEVDIALVFPRDEATEHTSHSGDDLKDAISVNTVFTPALPFSKLLTQIHDQFRKIAEQASLCLESWTEGMATTEKSSDNWTMRIFFNIEDALGLVRKEEKQEVQANTLPSLEDSFSTELIWSVTGASCNVQLLSHDITVDEDKISGMREHLVSLLAQIAEQPDLDVDTVSFLTPYEKEQLLSEWCAPHLEFPQEQCVHELFDLQAQSTPDAIAVESLDARMSYRELAEASNRLANYLETRGVVPGDHVGIYMSRSVHMAVAKLAVLKCGGAYVPLDISYPVSRLEYMAGQAELGFLIIDEADLELGSDVTKIHLGTEQDSIASQAMTYQQRAHADLLAYVIFTSGSTGFPKGVAIRHRSLTGYLYSIIHALDISSADRVLQFAPISFDATIEEIFPFWLSGATVVFVPDPYRYPDSAFTTYIIEQHISVLSLPTAFWHSWVEDCGEFGFPLPDNLRMVLLNAEQPSMLIYEKWLQLAGDQIRLINTYGPTEATVTTTLFDMSQMKEEYGRIPAGYAIPNARMYVLDERQQLMPPGFAGELYIGGEGVAYGYLQQPDLNRSVFLDNPFEPGARMYKTGDLVRYHHDGCLEIVGRIDNQVKIRGFRIELGEIEALLSQHPLLKNNVAMVHEFSPDDKRIVLYYVPKMPHTGAVSTEELYAFLKDRLPEYMMPSFWIELDSIPLLPNGKLDRKSLPWPERKHEDSSDLDLSEYQPTERQVLAIWSDVLGLSEIGLHDPFFMLGGHSLLATRIISRIRQSYPIDMTIAEFFERPTIAGLSALIDGRLLNGNESELRPALLPQSNLAKPEPSFAQKRFWFTHQLHQDSYSDHMPYVWDVKGSLNLDALERAIHQILSRHQILRSKYPNIGGEPGYATVPISADDSILTYEDKIVTHSEALQWMKQEVKRPFDLTLGQLVHIRLFRLGEEEYLLFLNMHHIVSDEWSVQLFVRELGLLYGDYLLGRPTSLEPLKVQYEDYAQIQKQWLSGDVLRRHEEYWVKQLADLTPLSLPTDRSKSKQQNKRSGKTLAFHIEDSLNNDLKRICETVETTLYMTLLSAFNVLLYRYTYQEDIAVGSPITNRNWPETEELIGLFVNTLVLRTHVSPEQSFLDLLEQAKKVSIEAYAHQEYPFEQLVEKLQPERKRETSPLFQVFFALHNTPDEKVIMPNLNMELYEMDFGIAQFDLSLTFKETEHGLTGEWVYDTDLFHEATIVRMKDHLVTLLEAVVAQPQLQLKDISIQSEAEHQLMIQEWNQTERSFPGRVALPELVSLQAMQTPAQTALTFGEDSISYQQLESWSNKLAFRLLEHVQPGDCVALYMERSMEMMVGILGIMKSGCAYVPIDPALPADRISYMLSDSGASLVLCDSSMQVPQDYVGHIMSVPPMETNQKDEERLSFTNLQDLAYIMYTSGSTGRPKGVEITHEALVNFAHSMIRLLDFKAGDRIAALTTVSFDIFALEALVPLIVGMEVALASGREQTDVHALNQFLARTSPDWMQLTPSRLQQIWVDEQMEQRLSGMTGILLGGEALPMALLQQLQSRFQGKIFNLYGPTETTVWSLSRDLTHADTVDLGRPIDNTELYILDPYLNPVPIGVAGELHIGGKGLARGYHNLEQLTSEKFIAHPYRSGERVYKTGDLAKYRADGHIEYLGRADYQVKVRGFRIELHEIEQYMHQHAAVDSMVVTVNEAVPRDKQLVGYFVVKSGLQVTVSELREFARQSLPYYMIPTLWVELESMPLSPSGKINRKALPEPDDSHVTPSNDYVEPTTDLEAVLCQICANVLSLEQVGIHDHFFEIGGHSLKLTQFLFQVEQACHISIPLGDIFDHPTVHELATYIEETHPDWQLTSKPLTAIQREETADIVVDALTEKEVEELLAALLEEDQHLG